MRGWMDGTIVEISGWKMVQNDEKASVVVLVVDVLACLVSAIVSSSTTSHQLISLSQHLTFITPRSCLLSCHLMF